MTEQDSEKSKNVKKWLITVAWIGTAAVVIALIVVLHFSL